MPTSKSHLVIAIIALGILPAIGFFQYCTAHTYYDDSCVNQIAKRLHTNDIVKIELKADALFIARDEFGELHLISYHRKEFKDELILHTSKQ